MRSFLSEKYKNTIHISPVKHWFVYLHTSQSHRNYINIEHCRCNISFLIKEEWNKVAESELQEIFQSLHFILAYSYSLCVIHLQWRFKGQTWRKMFVRQFLVVLQKVLRETGNNHYEITRKIVFLKVQVNLLMNLWWNLFYVRLQVSFDQELYWKQTSS